MLLTNTNVMSPVNPNIMVWRWVWLTSTFPLNDRTYLILLFLESSYVSSVDCTSPKTERGRHPRRKQGRRRRPSTKVME